MDLVQFLLELALEAGEIIDPKAIQHGAIFILGFQTRVEIAGSAGSHLGTGSWPFRSCSEGYQLLLLPVDTVLEEMNDLLGIIGILLMVRTFVATAFGGAIIGWATYQSQWQSLNDISMSFK